MEWTKKGLVFVPDGSWWWARKNATLPTALLMNDRIRVYYAALDQDNVGRIGYVDLDAGDPRRVIDAPAHPVLDVGELASFDESGVNASAVLRRGSSTYLYYQGWQHLRSGAYHIYTGLAIDATGAAVFRKVSRSPILDRVEDDRFIRAAPTIIEEGGSYRMWYVSGRRWLRDEHGLHYDVCIRHARSSDGIHWTADALPCIQPASPDEYAVGRPSVMFESGRYRMWYSIRSFTVPYRLGYAESEDGLRWVRRDDEINLPRSPSGWDSEMLCYPNVVRHEGRLLMFYNGNRHGASGFGLAEAR